MKIRRTIEFSGKNLNDVFSLPCVKCIMKVDETDRYNGMKGGMLLVCYRVMMRGGCIAKIGDRLVQYTDNSWEIL